MSTPFQCPSFKLTFPREITEASTYCFVLSGPEEFKPSVTIKWQMVAEDAKPRKYADDQVAKMRDQLKNFEMLEPAAADNDPNRVRLVFEWGEGRRTFRQLQTFLLHGKRMYTLTGTALNITFDKYRSELEEIIAGFSPTAGER